MRSIQHYKHPSDCLWTARSSVFYFFGVPQRTNRINLPTFPKKTWVSISHFFMSVQCLLPSCSHTPLRVLFSGTGAVDEIPSRISGIPSPRDRIPDVFVGSTTAPFSIAADECVDNKPHPLFNCRHHKKFRKCRSSIMIRGDFCARTCGRCEEKKIVSPNPVTVEIAVCDDVPPDDQFSCADQYRFGKCDERFILDGNYCAHTCRRYPCVEVRGSMRASLYL